MALSALETQRLAQLEVAVNARRGQKGYKRNVMALDEEIAKLTKKRDTPES